MDSELNFKNRFMNANNPSTHYVSSDCTDFQINEPKPFTPKWFSHKFKGAGVRYLIGVCLRTGWIVYVDGGYMAGTSERTITRIGICRLLKREERIIADKGVSGVENVTTPKPSDLPHIKK